MGKGFKSLRGIWLFTYHKWTNFDLLMEEVYTKKIIKESKDWNIKLNVLTKLIICLLSFIHYLNRSSLTPFVIVFGWPSLYHLVSFCPTILLGYKIQKDILGLDEGNGQTSKPNMRKCKDKGPMQEEEPINQVWSRLWLKHKRFQNKIVQALIGARCGNDMLN